MGGQRGRDRAGGRTGTAATKGTEGTGGAVTERELRELVATAGRVLYHQGLTDYLGHCSARVPGTDRVIIKPKHSKRVRSPAALGPGDMVVIDLDGNLLEGSDPPPAERFIHTEIYRARPDVSAVVHTHQRAATLLGVIGADLLPVLHVPAVLTDGGAVATWPCPLLVTSPELGRGLAAQLGSGRLCHLQGHGIVSVAAGVPRATVTAIAFEQLAEANLTILRTGRAPRVITPGELDELRGSVASVDGRWAYYLQLLEGEICPC
ncbi:MAG TPA: class II aldolase/adducin family protein [Streptosporangiaceae bacterium]|nr:class II aldolase/adducin family protein [Streptosporangiaceae bacterium]